MSLLGKIADIGRSLLSNPVVTKVASVIPGIGTGIAMAGTAYQAYQALKTPAVMPGGATQIQPLPMTGQTMQAGMFPTSLAGVGRALPAAGAVIVRGAKSVGRAAANLCRKYPQWCSTIGGTAAVEALLHSGQLPMPKRHRGKGITAHELRAFKRVARFTSKYCAPVHRAMRSPAMRRGRASCR